MALRPYNDPEYRRAKAHLAAAPAVCQLRLPGCTTMATTLDHQPRIVEHEHRRGTGCCRLVPACARCNASDGATAGNRKRSTGYAWP